MQGRDEDDFETLFMTLPSNGGSAQYVPTNTNTQYKVKLPYRLRLPGKGWQVALSSISMPRPTRKAVTYKTSLYEDHPQNDTHCTRPNAIVEQYRSTHPADGLDTYGGGVRALVRRRQVEFHQTLRLLLEQAVYATFYANVSLDGQKLSSTESGVPNIFRERSGTNDIGRTLERRYRCKQ